MRREGELESMRILNSVNYVNVFERSRIISPHGRIDKQKNGKMSACAELSGESRMSGIFPELQTPRLLLHRRSERRERARRWPCVRIIQNA